MTECCIAAEKRLIEAGFDATKAHVKALREHSDGKHVSSLTIEEPKVSKR